MSAEYEAAVEIREAINGVTEALQELRDATRENTLTGAAAVMLLIQHSLKPTATDMEALIDLAHRSFQDAHEALVRFNHEPEPR